MRDRNAAFVGCDIGDKFTELCVVDRAGTVIDARRVRTTKPALVQAIRKHAPARVAIEAGTHSRWVEEALAAAGHEVVVANPRQIQLIWKRKKKTDRSDANLLARLARIDVTMLAPVHHRSRAAQVDLAVLRSRDLLVAVRTRLINHDGFLRRLLVQCAHRLLGPFGPDCDLRRWGLALCARGGTSARKRAIVAVARKLSVLLHRIWVTGRPYDPHFNALVA